MPRGSGEKAGEMTTAKSRPTTQRSLTNRFRSGELVLGNGNIESYMRKSLPDS